MLLSPTLLCSMTIAAAFEIGYDTAVISEFDFVMDSNTSVEFGLEWKSYAFASYSFAIAGRVVC